MKYAVELVVSDEEYYFGRFDSLEEAEKLMHQVTSDEGSEFVGMSVMSGQKEVLDGPKGLNPVKQLIRSFRVNSMFLYEIQDEEAANVGQG